MGRVSAPPPRGSREGKEGCWLMPCITGPLRGLSHLPAWGWGVPESGLVSAGRILNGDSELMGVQE